MGKSTICEQMIWDSHIVSSKQKDEKEKYGSFTGVWHQRGRSFWAGSQCKRYFENCKVLRVAECQDVEKLRAPILVTFVGEIRNR